MQNEEDPNRVNLRYKYSGYGVNDQNFVDYMAQKKNVPIKIKKVLIFIHYYDDNHNNEQCFSSNLFVGNEKSIPRVKWLIINDCNIPSSSMIFPAVKNFRNLIGLDLSFNNICNISAIAHLIKSPKLMYLDLSHNPLEFQEDLKEVILKINPYISVINRKRVTPTDFYNIITKNSDFLNNKGNNNEIDFNLNDIQTFRRCQLFSAIRSIQKDRIYPLTAEIYDDYIDDSFNLRDNYIDTSKIQAIDLSNCDLIYFDFSMFKNAFFIDISNNHLKSDHDFKFSVEANRNLLYLNVSGNDFKNYNLLEAKFPNCNIIPHHSAENEKYEISNIPKTVDIYSHNIQNFQELLDNFQEFGIKERKNDSEIMIFLRDINSNIKFVEMISNDLHKVSQNKDNYTINFIAFKETLNNINMRNSDETIFDERVQKLSIHTVDENNCIINRKLNKNLSFWFISYLNLNSFSIEAKDFHIILTHCLNLRKLAVKFIYIHKTVSDSNQIISDYYFHDVEENVLLYLTDLDIDLSNYSFDTKKQYNKFIKKIAYFRSLKNFCITDYTNKYSENDEIDTTFKYLRGLNTFNGYRNLMPPTPSQYCALNAFITNDNDIKDDNEYDFDDDSNNNNNNNNNENINNRNNKYSFNLNNMQFFKLYENDLNHTSGNHRWLQALPIRSINVFENNNENKKVGNVKKVINDKSEFFDQFPRLRYVNGMRIKRDLPTKSREESLDENKAFESWTSKLDEAFEFIYQLQFFLVYSFSASSSFVSKFLYFLYSTWIILERFFIKHNITLSTDFTSTYERIFVYSLAPFVALIFLLWEPSYEDFTSYAKNKKRTICRLLGVELCGAFFIFLCSVLDSLCIEHEFVFFPYFVQFSLFSLLIFLIILYYIKHVQMELEEEYKEEFDQQSKNSFIGYLEFKFLKSKVAYSILSILILPICGLVFESKLQFTFVDCYKCIFTVSIISYVFYMLFKSTNDDTAKIIDYLDLENNKDESSNNKKSHEIELEEIRENENKYKTHYLVTKSKDDDNEKKCSLSKFNKIFGGAFHWRLTADDLKYQSFAAEFRTPTQIFYSQYRYRGLQKFYGLIEVIQRILTEFITCVCPRFLFIVPVLFTIYVALWWPNYDNIINISTIVTSVGKVLMSLFNFLFDSFGIENKRAESILTYMNLVGIVLNVFGIGISGLYSFCQIYFESREKRKVYKPDRYNLDDINYRGLNQHLIANDDDDDSL